jgi:hypothetical protein
MHIDPFPQNDAGAQKTNAGDDLGGDAGGVALADHGGENYETTRA